MTALKVLMADDEVDLLDVMACQIEEAGYIIIKARDGVEAWEKIQTAEPDIILLDLIMPRMNGYEVLKKLRHEHKTDKWQPVIIVSAKGEFEDIQKGFDLEADHYIAKPCTAADILKGLKLMSELVPQHKTYSEIEKDKNAKKDQWLG